MSMSNVSLLTIVAGVSSTGKSTSLRNLGSETVILNTEQKELPFFNEAIMNVPINSVTKLKEAIRRLSENDEKKIIVIDSFSEYVDMVLAECKTKYKGFDVWNAYNTEIYNLFNELKAMKNKYIFVIGHTEVLADPEGARIYRVRAQGKAWEGQVEKTATCVLFSNLVPKTSGKGVLYKFLTNTDGMVPAKTPLGMFDQETELMIDNDIKQVVQRYDAFYKKANPIFPLKAQ